jgi:hypothetical protein
MKKYYIVFLILFISATSFAQLLPPKEASPLTVKQIHSGHSLTDPLFNPWPGQYRFLIYDILEGEFDNLGKSTIPGSSLNYRWENPPNYGPDARHEINDWELLIITERVPLLYEGGSTQDWYINGIVEQRENLSLFVNNSWNNGDGGNGAPTLLWTTWTNIDDSDGPWREMLNVQGEEWEKMQDHANENRPDGAPPVYIIPGHKMMARIYDDIELNLVPGITDISQFFSDNIHLNEYGQYAAAMIHYACTYNTSPVGLTNILLPDTPELCPSLELATYLQTIIWEEVTNYDRTGISLALSISEESNSKIKVYPNPANTEVHLIGNDPIDIRDVELFSLFGFNLTSAIRIEKNGSNSLLIDLAGLRSGTYLVKTKTSVHKFQVVRD